MSEQKYLERITQIQSTINKLTDELWETTMHKEQISPEFKDILKQQVLNDVVNTQSDTKRTPVRNTKTTEFERIKNMDEMDLAIYLTKLQEKTIDDYENGIAPKGIVATMTMLKTVS